MGKTPCRKRTIRTSLYLSEKEEKEFKRNCIKTGLSKSQLLRYLVLNYTPPEAPPIDYPIIRKKLSCIGNDINHILLILRANGIINMDDFKNELEKLNEVEDCLIKSFDIERTIYNGNSKNLVDKK